MGAVGNAHALAVVPTVPAGGEPREVLAVRDPDTDVAQVGFNGYAWSADGRAIYFVGRDPPDGGVAVWQLPATGGVPRPMVRFDDLSHRWTRTTGIRVRDGRFYFNLGDQQSDLWMADIAGSR